MPPVRIFSSDLLIADIIVFLAENPRLAVLAKQCRLHPGSKVTIEAAQLAEFSAAVEGSPVIVTPGGSSANMLATLAGLLRQEVSVRFLGIAGDDAYGAAVRQSLDEA